MVIGGHSDAVGAVDWLYCNSVPVSEFLSEDRLKPSLRNTKVGGTTLVAKELLSTLRAAVQDLCKAGADQKKIILAA
jgi:hypothetical protein